MIPLTEDKRMLGYGIMLPYPDIFCFSTSRHGGCSTGNYASFNCTSYTGDDALCVQRNCEILSRSMPCPPTELIIPFQVHDTKVAGIGQEYIEASAEERWKMLQGVDALITREPGYCICVSTADCIPILLYDPVNRVVAVVHAGWRGTVNLIVKKTLEEMNRQYGTKGQDIIACIGPGISLDSFEVGEEVYEAFRDKGFDMDAVSRWNSDTSKHHIDLWKSNSILLQGFGVPEGQIELSGICTYIHHEDFFSARRLGIKSGRILSGIMLK
mgnify:CR=1 FL=1